MGNAKENGTLDSFYTKYFDLLYNKSKKEKTSSIDWRNRDEMLNLLNPYLWDDFMKIIFSQTNSTSDIKHLSRSEIFMGILISRINAYVTDSDKINIQETLEVIKSLPRDHNYDIFEPLIVMLYDKWNFDHEI